MNSTDISSLTLLKTINEQSCPILSLIVLSDGRLASCSYTKDVKIYDILSNIQEKNLELYEAELEFIKAVIEICENRGRY